MDEVSRNKKTKVPFTLETHAGQQSCQNRTTTIKTKINLVN